MALAVAGTAAPGFAQAPGLMSWADLNKAPKPKPTRKISYGGQSSQFVELWQPNGLGPHPVVVMIHGGCWQVKIAGLDIMDYAAADLQRRGIAVWNIEYRRLGEPGGGYPGTFQDVGHAVDLLRIYAKAYSLDLKHTVVIGHSAGGHLALWAAARWKLPPSRALYTQDPLRFKGVVDLAGLPDLEHDTQTGCGADVLSELVGPTTPAHPAVYADTSPAALVPLHVRQIVIHGHADTTVPLGVGQSYATLARKAGDEVTVLSPPGGHVEEIAPGTQAWAREVQAIEGLLPPIPPSPPAYPTGAR